MDVHLSFLAAGLRATAAFAVLLAFAQGGAQAQNVMKVGNATINDVQHEWQKLFAERLNKRAEGKLKVEIYPASQLGPQPRMIEGLQLGTVEALIIPPQFLVGVDPRFQVLAAPGLIENFQHAYRMCQDPTIRQALFTWGEAKGIKGISCIVYGPTVIASRSPLRSLADLRGVKVRVLPSPVEVEPVKRLGAAPIPMPLTEALTALQTGTIDAVYGGLTVFAGLKYYDTAKYILETEWAYALAVTYVSKAWFDRLDPALQAIVTDEAKGIEPELLTWVLGQQDRAKQTWKSNGGEIALLSSADRATMMKTVESAGEEVMASQPVLKDAYATIKARILAVK